MTEEKAPRTINKPGPRPTVTAVVVEEEPAAETKVITVNGEKHTVKIVWVGNKAILAESIYKTVALPNTEKTTRVLIVAKGTAIQGY